MDEGAEEEASTAAAAEEEDEAFVCVVFAVAGPVAVTEEELLWCAVADAEVSVAALLGSNCSTLIRLRLIDFEGFPGNLERPIII